MINPKDKFFSEGQNYFGSGDDPRTEAFCNVWNWDELRMVKVKGTARVFPRSEDREIDVLARFADYLSPKVTAIAVDDNGLLYEVSTDLEEDDTMYVPYHRFSTIPSFAGCRTVAYSELKELDRLGPGVNLSSYKSEHGEVKVAFKFNPNWKPKRLKKAWDEIHILKGLPAHPNLIPFDRLVLEDVESRVIGFTTKYIASNTLEDQTIPFRFEWLQQLTDLVDFLNLELGIIHQDIAPRNLLVDPDTHKILLFDFDWAARRNSYLMDGRDDVSGVVFALYELVTNEKFFAGVPHWERDMQVVQNMSEWKQNRELDSDVSVFRSFLDAWVAKRHSQEIDQSTDAPRQISWPDAPHPPDYDVPFEHGTTWSGETNWITGPRLRSVALEKGQYCFRWERPPQCRLNRSEAVRQ